MGIYGAFAMMVSTLGVIADLLRRLSVFFGWLGDKISGRRTPFLLGVIVLGLSTLCFALGSTLPVLFIARVLEGLSTSIVCTLGYALLNDVVGTAGIGKATGYTDMALSLGILLGPVIGGFLYEYGGYFQVFLPAMGLLAVELILRLMIIDPEEPSPFAAISPKPSKSRSSLTIADGHTYGTTGTVPARNDLMDEYRPAEVDPGSASRLVTSTETQPLLPMIKPQAPGNAFAILLSEPRFLVAIMGIFILLTIATGFDGVLAPYIRDTFDLNPIHAAGLFLAIALPMMLAPISGILTDRYGPKWPAFSGFLLAVPSLILLRLVTRGVTLPSVKLAVLLFCFGLALALSLPPLRVEAIMVVKAIEEERPGVFGQHGAYSQAYGLLNFASAAGSTIGPLYAGMVRVWLGWRSMSLSMGLLSAVMLVFVIAVTGRSGRRCGQAAADSSDSCSDANT